MPTATKLPKVSQYVKNVGKSIAFASIEGVKGNMPGMTSFAKENKETFRDIYGSVKNMRDTMNSVERDVTGKMVEELINTLTTNHTYFMREKEHFEFFREVVLPELKEAKGEEKDLRIWC